MATQPNQFTPGPWEYRAEHGNNSIFAPNEGHGGAVLASVFRIDGDYRDPLNLPAEANAHLIAAAPELLAALETINRRGSPKPDRTLGDCADELQMIVDIARAAIAMAKSPSTQPVSRGA